MRQLRKKILFVTNRMLYLSQHRHIGFCGRELIWW